MKDPRVEQWLASRNISFEYEPALDIDQIDVAVSAKNLARFAPLDEDVVRVYADAMTAGKAFPAIVVRKRAGRHQKPYVVIDGNHRLQASLKLDRSVIASYVVSDPPAELLRILLVEGNAMGGFALSRDEKLAHAVSLVDMGMKYADAAAAVELPVSAVQAAVGLNKGQRRAINLGIKDWDELPSGHRRRLAEIKADPVFVQAVKVATTTRMPQQELAGLTSRISKARSERAQLDVIDEYARDHAAAAAVPERKVPRSMLTMQLGGILGTDWGALKNSLTAEARTLLLAKIDQTVEVLTAGAKMLRSR